MSWWTKEHYLDCMSRRITQEQHGIAVVKQLPVSLLKEVLADPERVAKAKELGWNIEEMRRIIAVDLGAEPRA